MEHSVLVVVTDDAHKPVAGARVCVVAKSALGTERHPYPSLAATHSDVGGGKYDDGKKIALSEGDWVLVATLKGKAPVVQPLKVKKGTDGSFIITPSPGPVATVIIPNAGRKAGGDKHKGFLFKVRLYPAAELVFLGGVDYNRRDVSGGWQFQTYGFNRAESLRREKKIHPGTIITVFSMSKISRTTRVWGEQQERWIDVEVAQLGDPTKRKLPAPGEIYQPERGLDIHIVDFYKYLAAVGTREPKSVKEIGIISHSWPGGPVLYNTMEPDGPPIAARYDQDFDARAKDFNSTNFPAYQKLVDALAPGCRFTIWGCSATTHFKFRSRESLHAMQKGRAEDDFFWVDSDDWTHSEPRRLLSIIKEHTSELRHRFDMDRRFRGLGDNYAAAVAKALKIEVRAGCPGTSADPTPVKGLEMLMVSLKTYKEMFEYFHRRFGPEFAETKGEWDQGYVDYHAIQSRPPIARPPFSMKYCYVGMDLDHKPVPYVRITFWNGIYHEWWTPTAKDLQVVTTEVPNLATPGMKGQLFVLKEKDPDKSQALYVQEDQRVFQMVKLPDSHNWEKLRELVRRP